LGFGRLPCLLDMKDHQVVEVDVIASARPDRCVRPGATSHVDQPGRRRRQEAVEQLQGTHELQAWLTAAEQTIAFQAKLIVCGDRMVNHQRSLAPGKRSRTAHSRPAPQNALKVPCAVTTLVVQSREGDAKSLRDARFTHLVRLQEIERQTAETLRAVGMNAGRPAKAVPSHGLQRAARTRGPRLVSLNAGCKGIPWHLVA